MLPGEPLKLAADAHRAVVEVEVLPLQAKHLALAEPQRKPH